MGRMGHMGGHSHGHRNWHGGHRGFGRGAAIGFAGGVAAALIIAAANQPSAEAYNPQTGERVRSSGKPGRHVIVRTDRDGNKNAKVAKRTPDSATAVEGDRTATSTSNGNGTRTVDSNDGKGNAQRTVSGGEPASMSWTDPSTGVTTTITSNGAGGNNMVRTNAAGEVLP
jgi:hypothetical protein